MPIGFDQFLLKQSGGLAPRPLQEIAPFGRRRDGGIKGTGFFGPLPGKKGIATEIAVGINLNGRERLVPALVPTLTKPEVDFLLAGNVPFENEDIMQKIYDFALKREKSGQPFFAN